MADLYEGEGQMSSWVWSSYILLRTSWVPVQTTLSNLAVQFSSVTRERIRGGL